MTLSGQSTEKCRVPGSPRLRHNSGQKRWMQKEEVVLEKVERFDGGVELLGRYRW